MIRTLVNLVTLTFTLIGVSLLGDKDIDGCMIVVICFVSVLLLALIGIVFKVHSIRKNKHQGDPQ